MTREEAKAIIRKEYLCVDRDCDIERSCGTCDLMMPSKEPILRAYGLAIKALEYDDAKYHEEHGEVIVDKGLWEDAKKALEQEPCDAISKQTVLNYIYNDLGLGDEENGKDVERQMELESSYRYVKSLPPVKLQEPKTGHWIKYGIPRCGEQHYKCTNCDEYFNFGLYSDYYKKAFKYCPNCGAKMIEPQESEG